SGRQLPGGVSAWSPDESRLLVYGPNGPSLGAVDGTGFHAFSIDGWVKWAPDSSRLVARQGANQLVVADADGNVPHLVATLDGLGDVEWAPNGTNLAVTSE